MSVYNGERFLAEAIESILTQTWTDFEFVIIDDGSTDSTAQILRDFEKKDARIRIITNEKNFGLTKSLNMGIAVATGEYIARMDADDISFPTRLEKQMAFLNDHPNIVVVGTGTEIIDADGKRMRSIATPKAIQTRLPKRNCLVHGSLLIRKEALQDVGGYDESIRYAQDYDLLLRLLDGSNIAVIDEPLYALRVTRGRLSSKKFFQQVFYAAKAKYRYRQRIGKRIIPGITFFIDLLYTFFVIYKMGAGEILRLFRLIK